MSEPLFLSVHIILSSSLGGEGGLSHGTREDVSMGSWRVIQHRQFKNLPQSIHHIFLKFHFPLRFTGDGIIVPEEFDLRFESLLPSIQLMDKADRFYVYDGSLSTPGCYESVVWVVMGTHPTVTEEQVLILYWKKLQW